MITPLPAASPAALAEMRQRIGLVCLTPGAAVEAIVECLPEGARENAEADLVGLAMTRALSGKRLDEHGEVQAARVAAAAYIEAWGGGRN